MTIDEALGVRDGDYVTSPHTVPALQPLRVTHTWVNGRRTIVRFRFGAHPGWGWADSSGFRLPPVGSVWDTRYHEWLDLAQWRVKYPEMKPPRLRGQRAA